MKGDISELSQKYYVILTKDKKAREKNNELIGHKRVVKNGQGKLSWKVFAIL